MQKDSSTSTSSTYVVDDGSDLTSGALKCRAAAGGHACSTRANTPPAPAEPQNNHLRKRPWDASARRAEACAFTRAARGARGTRSESRRTRHRRSASHAAAEEWVGSGHADVVAGLVRRRQIGRCASGLGAPEAARGCGTPRQRRSESEASARTSDDFRSQARPKA